MNMQRTGRFAMAHAAMMLAAILVTTAPAHAGDRDRDVLIVASTNNPSGNDVVVFRFDRTEKPSLSLADTIATGGNGGAKGNGGIVQFQDDLGAVANYGSNTVTELARYGNFISVTKMINLAPTCVQPDSVALSKDQLFVVGTNCAESHSWPSGKVDGPVVKLSDSSAAQIAVGKTWAAVTLGSGTVLQLPLASREGPLGGTGTAIALPSPANNTPLGEAFWGNVLGFTPAHSPDSFAIVDKDRNVFPILGPAPAYPTNAPCWVAKGPASVWYTGNAPGDAISEFFTDKQGGVFYKSVPLPGSPTDVAVSADQKWLAVIYTAGGQGYIAVFSIDRRGDLTPLTTSSAVGIAAFNGVAISE
jgi:hypothetical protein